MWCKVCSNDRIEAPLLAPKRTRICVLSRQQPPSPRAIPLETQPMPKEVADREQEAGEGGETEHNWDSDISALGFCIWLRRAPSPNPNPLPSYSKRQMARSTAMQQQQQKERGVAGGGGVPREEWQGGGGWCAGGNSRRIHVARIRRNLPVTCMCACIPSPSLCFLHCGYWISL